MKILTAFLFLMMIGYTTIAQVYPEYNQYQYNPYVYNPAALGNSRQLEVNLSYRQMWTGIEDAPRITSFNVQVPTKNNFSFGALFYSEKSILLNSSSLMLGGAYQVNLGEMQDLKFGLNIGLGVNNFDLDEINSDDPAFVDAIALTNYLNGQAGVQYRFKNLTIGAALPQLFEINALDTDKMQQITISQLRNWLVSASYRFVNKNGRIVIEPILLYRKGELYRDQIEGGTFVHMFDRVSVGATYRKDFGVIGHIGVNVTPNIGFSYGYEMPQSIESGISGATHELNLKIKFGKKRSSGGDNKHKSNVSEQIYSEQIMEKTEEQDKTSDEHVLSKPLIKDSTEDLSIIPEDSLRSENIKNRVIEHNYPNTSKYETISGGHYIVAGVFSKEENAERYQKRLEAMNLQSKINFNPANNFYYVFVDKQGDKESLYPILDSLRKMDGFKEAWILSVE